MKRHELTDGQWALVQPEIAKHTRICTYDRAGYAWSERRPLLDGIEQIMDELVDA